MPAPEKAAYCFGGKRTSGSASMMVFMIGIGWWGGYGFYNGGNAYNGGTPELSVGYHELCQIIVMEPPFKVSIRTFLTMIDRSDLLYNPTTISTVCLSFSA